MKKRHYINILQQFLLTLFSLEKKYQSKRINGFILEKRLDNNLEYWEVNVFTEEGWKRYKNWNKEL